MQPFPDRARIRLVSIDMQRLFLEPGPWFCPAGLDILPSCKSIIQACPDRCLHTRFIPARNANHAVGSWKTYYHHWNSVLLDRTGPEKIELHPDLQALARHGQVLDKLTYDSFKSPAFAAAIDECAPELLIMFGVETDVCVLSTALSAVDRGIRVVIPSDAVASGDTAAHRAALDTILPRLDLQVDISTTRAILRQLA